ncbi:MAG: dTMP kinase [Candidatus Paceibacterota bacterium]|jgi:dTMP kinase
MIGKLIVIEGTDGSGKTTQTELLIERLKRENISSESLRFPRYEDNLFGKLIRECLDGFHGDFISLDPKIASVLYACDRRETIPLIRQWLEDGKTVILDRYVSSNQIHQGGKIKNEKERAEFLEWLSEMEYEKLGILKPHAVIYLEVPFETSKTLIENRIGTKDLADEDWEYLANSKAAGVYMTSKEASWQRVDCAPEGQLLTREAIHELIWEKVSPMLK